MRKMPATATMALLLIAIVGIAACGSEDVATTIATGAPTTGSAPTGATTTGSVSTQTTAQTEVFTLNELARFDGSDGRAAYVAVDGVVYDVSASARWSGGTHSACNLGAMAGQDLSELIAKAPGTMRSLLAKMPVVGTLE
jgi:predicted heme/steroid binding protein